MQHTILLVALPHAFAWRGDNEFDFTSRTDSMILDPGVTTETSLPLEEVIFYKTSSNGIQGAQSFSVPVVPPPTGGQHQSEMIQLARDMFQRYMDALPPPPNTTACQIDQIPKNRAFVFAIGSIFNDDSRRASKLQSDLSTGRLDKPDTVRPAMLSSPATCPLFAVLKTGFRRMWTYPSGSTKKFWALSLHKDTAESPAVLGSLTEVDKDWFGMMRPRESDYDVLPIEPEIVEISTMKQTLRDMYPCDKLFVFAYGYKHPTTDMPDGITDIFKVEERIALMPPYNEAPVADQINTMRLCELGQDRVGGNCANMLMRTYGHVLAQSYIDVIIAGILETGFTTKVGEFLVHGGASTETIKEKYPDHVLFAKIFADTTTWPVTEVKEKRVLYINDRACPRNGNPMYTPKEHLHPPHLGGISSTVPAKDIENLYTMIDDIIAVSEDGKEMMKYRIEGADVCEKLDVIPRWMNKQLQKEDSLWDIAYRRVPNEDEELPPPAQNCQYTVA